MQSWRCLPAVLVLFAAFGARTAFSQQQTFIEPDATTSWRYYTAEAAPPSNWADLAFDDSGWSAGPALLGAGSNTNTYTSPPVRTGIPAPLTSRAYYFRHKFSLGGASGVTLQLTHWIDDGAIFFLNGVEVLRVNMPAGAVTHTTSASSSVNTAPVGGTGPVTISAASLNTGDNVLAVQVHQASSTGLDVVFGVRLAGTVRDLVINEFLADNRTVESNNGRFSDWLEIYNKSQMAANLQGMSLTDDNLVPNKFVFPAGTVVPGNGYFRVWCDSETNSPGLHTLFNLRASAGGTVYLYNGPVLKDSVSFGIQAPDYTVGRIPNGTGSFTLNQPTPLGANVAATLGATSGLKINEWAATTTQGDDWFELFNGGSNPVSLGGFYLTDDFNNRTKSQIPSLSFIAPGSHVVFFADGNITNGANHVGFKLTASGDFIGLYNTSQNVIDSVTFGAQTADVSQGRLPDGSSPIVFFPTTATPGESNYLPLTTVVINEALAHSDPPVEDAIELFNTTSSPIDLSGWWLSDRRSELRMFKIPSGTTIPANGFRVFYEYQFNNIANTNVARLPFSLSSAKGDEIYLSSADSSGVLNGYRGSVRFGPSANGVSFGRHLTSVGSLFVPMERKTFGVDNPGSVEEFRLGQGAPNSQPLVGPVTISEIMYHPINGTNELASEEFIELHNITDQQVLLYDPEFRTNRWRIRDAVDFDFPEGANIPARGFVLVVSFNPSDAGAANTFRSRYAVPSSVALYGPWSGRLANSSETIELQRPDTPQGPTSPDPGLVPYIELERVKYADVAPWPNADGNGLSLQRKRVAQFSNDPANWTAATPSAGLPLDSDRDGMPDEYEQQFSFLNPHDAADAGRDQDGDGMTNLQEYRAGTDPNSAASVLRFSRVEFDGTRTRLRFQAVGGKSYSVQFRNSLVTGSWSNLPGGNVSTSTTSPVEVEDTTFGSGTMRYYRIVTPQQ